MAKLLTGSVDLNKIDPKLIKEVKKKDGTTAKFINVNIWVNDDADQFGNNASIQQYAGKDAEKIYLGNAKFWEKKEDGASGDSSNSLPF
jgi:hypothetical protein